MTTTMNSFRLDGKVALVSGGAGLYGRHICAALADAGAHVVVASRDVVACRDVADELTASGASASAVELDQSDDESIRTACTSIIDDHGTISVLINNAVARKGGGIDTAERADLRTTAEVNYLGLVQITRHVGAHMIEQRSGSIVNVGSIYGVVGPQLAVYDGTDIVNPAFYAFEKGGMVNLTRYLAAQYGPLGVRVNCLSPGGLATPDQPESFVAAYSSRTPLGRLAGPDDIKGPVIFLASDASGYVNGINLLVDGGWTAV